MSEGTFIVALVAVGITFLVTTLGASWKLGSMLAAQAQELKDHKTRLEMLQRENDQLKAAAELRRSEADTRWLSFTEKLSTITGLLSAHPPQR